MKLTSEQKEIVKTLREGWEVGYSNEPKGTIRPWSQEKLMHGGESKHFTWRAISGLETKNVIKLVQDSEKYWLTRVELTKLGREMELES